MRLSFGQNTIPLVFRAQKPVFAGAAQPDVITATPAQLLALLTGMNPGEGGLDVSALAEILACLNQEPACNYAEAMRQARPKIVAQYPELEAIPFRGDPQQYWSIVHKLGPNITLSNREG